MEKEEAIKIIVECAKKYKQNLLNRNLLFVCLDVNKNVKIYEMIFERNNFLHLTGVAFENKKLSAREFFNMSINGTLSPRIIKLMPDGTTELKLSVLPYLVSSYLGANMLGDFSSRTPFLYTEKLAGNVRGCMGFVLKEGTKYYIPNTVLNVDIRDVVKNKERIIAVYRKNINEKKYVENIHKVNNVDFNLLKYPLEFEYLKKL